MEWFIFVRDCFKLFVDWLRVEWVVRYNDIDIGFNMGFDYYEGYGFRFIVMILKCDCNVSSVIWLWVLLVVLLIND